MILFRQWYAARNLPGTAGLNVRHLQYIATRPGAVPNHGQTFGLGGRLPGQAEAADQKSLKAARNAIREASGQHTIYRAVLSVNQEDAENYGLYHREKWEDLLRRNIDTIRKEMGIKPEDFYWTASFHAELGHPHVHLLYWDSGTDPQKEGLSPERTKIMSEHVRAAFGRDVYQEDLHLFQVHQRELTSEMRQQIQAMCREANPEKSLDMKKLFKRPELEGLSRDLLEICRAVPKTGSLKYAYLPPEVKSMVDRLTDRCLREIPELAQTLEAYKSATVQISELYGNGEEAQAHNLDKALGKLRKELGNEVMSAVREVLDMLPPEDPPQPYDHEPEPSPEPAEPAQAEECSVPFAQNTGDVAELPEEIPEPKEETPNLEEAGPEHEPDVSNAEPGDDTWGGRPKRPRQETGSRGGDSWWTKQYNDARKLLFAVDEQEQDFGKARELLTAEAQRGNGFAMYDLGKMHLAGQGVEPDEEAAQTWFRQAYKAISQRERTASKEWDRVYCQYRLGKLYSYGHGVEQDYSQAAAWWEKAVAGGNASAAFSLGGLYHRGQGVEQDSVRAFDLFHMAATDEKNPNAYAAYNLGQMCRDGDGTEVDREAAEEWFRQAYEGFQGYVEKSPDDKLFYRLGRMNLDGVGTEVNPEQAKTYFEAAVRLKNNDARYGLARLYLATDAAWYAPEKAQALLEEAVQESHTMSQYLLGKLLYQGTEIPQDIPRAAELLEKAATDEDAPNAYAAYTLGQLYRGDRGGEADMGAAQRWFRLAYTLLQEDVEKSPSGFSYYRLGTMALEGLGTEADPKQAIAYFEKAIELGSNDARYSLAKMYLSADAAFYDPAKAAELLEEAVQEGHTQAAYMLGKLLFQGTEISQDIPRAAELLEKAATDEEAPNAYAAYTLGQLYRGDRGGEANEEAAQRWFRLAYTLLQEDVEKSPNGFSYYRLGTMALEGLGTEANREQAIAYFEKAAQLGSNDAQYNLARLLLIQDSPDYNPARAGVLLTDAADSGHTFAKYLLGKLLLQGDELPRDLPRALRYLESAAAEGNMAAVYTLGKEYVTAEILPLDMEKGILYLQQAAEAGNHYAEYQLGKVYFFGVKGALERDKDKGLHYLHQAAEHGNEPAKELLANISKAATANMLRGMMLLGSQLAHQRSAQAGAANRNRSRDMSREQRKDRQAQQSQAGAWEPE